MFDWRFPFQNRCKIERLEGIRRVTFVTASRTLIENAAVKQGRAYDKYW
jgi:hypothetical protein